MAPKTKPKRYRASFSTRVNGKLQEQSDHLSPNIVGFLFFETPLNVEKIKDEVLPKLFELPRMRSKYVYNKGRSYYEELPIESLDMSYHFQVHFEGEKPSEQDVLDFVTEDMKKDNLLDKDKPLWKLHIIPEMDDGGSCLITHISHIIGDGTAQVEILYHIMDKKPVEESQSSSDVRAKGKREKKKISFLKKSRIAVGGTMKGIFAVAGKADQQSSLKLKATNDISKEKKQAVTGMIPIEKVKDIKNKIEGATINDILVVLLTLCVRKYYDEHEPNLKLNRVTAAFPINLRKRGEGGFDKYGSPHNNFGIGNIPLVLKYKNNLDLIWKVKRSLDKAKLSPAPIVTNAVGKLVEPIMGMKQANDTVLKVANKSTVQLSNVAGPSQQVSIAGHKIDRLSFQLFSVIGVYLGIISYNGKVSCSVSVDSGLPDPKEISKHWNVEFDKLYDEIMSHPDEVITPPSGCM